MNNATMAATSGWAERPLSKLAGALCLLVLVIGILLRPEAGWSGLLIGGFFGLTLALGASLFAAINAVSGARWSAPFAVVPSALGRTLIVPALALAVTFLGGLSVLYPWAQPAVVEGSHLLQEKTAWLNVPFFLARAGIILLVLLAMTHSLFHRPASGNAAALPRPPAAAVFLVVFAVAITVGSWDWLMSLEPEWFSTMYGVYSFAGAFVGGIAAITVLSIRLSGSHASPVQLGERQLHDLGSLLFGFSVFWAYIWFCQYMLIWYANIPEETPYYARRLSYSWSMLFWLNPVVNFVVPFVVLLSSRAKRNPQVLMEVAGVVLAGRWLDTYLMVAPALARYPEFPVYALAATGAVLLGMLAIGQRHLRAVG